MEEFDSVKSLVKNSIYRIQRNGCQKKEDKNQKKFSNITREKSSDRSIKKRIEKLANWAIPNIFLGKLTLLSFILQTEIEDK